MSDDFDDDDLLDPAEIENLLRQQEEEEAANTLPESLSASAPTAAATGNAGNAPATISQDELEALMAGSPAPGAAPGGGGAASAPQAAPAGLNPDLAAILSGGGGGNGLPKGMDNPQSFAFQDLARVGGAAAGMHHLHSLKGVELDLSIELGRAEMRLEDVVQLQEGSVVPLDKLAGDPVDIIVNGRLIARGEVLVLNDNFCVRVAEILAPER